MSTRRTSPRKKPSLTPHPSTASTASVAPPMTSQDPEDDAEAANLSDELPEEVQTNTLADPIGLDTTPQSLPPRDQNPPKLFILPSPLHPDSRILTLPCPASAEPTRYLADPSGGFHEFTRVAAGPEQPRSVLFAPVRSVGDDGLEAELLRIRDLDLRAEEVTGVERGYVGEKPELFVATPVDLVFLLLPLMERAGRRSEGGKRLFVAFEEYVEETGVGMHVLLEWEGMRRRLEERMCAICEVLDAGGEMMYRFSEEKLGEVLVGKARRMVQQGLPESLEQQFVRQPLQPPLMSVKREDTMTSQMSELDAEAGAEAMQDVEMTDTQAIDDEHAPSTATEPTSASPEIINLLRLRTSLRLLSMRYLPSQLATDLQPVLSKLLDFTPLETHLAELKRLRSEATALSSLAVDLARKRGGGLEEDEEAAERAEKRRKREEEERKKKERARKGLGKVNVTGMAKMSSFFKPMAGGKKKDGL